MHHFIRSCISIVDVFCDGAEKDLFKYNLEVRTLCDIAVTARCIDDLNLVRGHQYRRILFYFRSELKEYR